MTQADVSRAETGDGAVHCIEADGIATLIFDRPLARNAMTWAMYGQLASHCKRLAASAVRAVMLRGAGDEAFVAGTDIAQFQAFVSGDDGVAYERRIDEGITLLERLPMPTVALIDGWAVGGGLALATACDFRLATPNARFGVPIAKTLGNTLSVANLARLQAAWGLQPVRRMLLLADLLNATEALACGFLHQICDRESLATQASMLCDRLRTLAPITQAVSKEGLRRLTANSLPDGDDLVHHSYDSDDFHEGVAAFVAKRQPVWRGR